mmetsp:Transcript_105064/g.250095  ORF Transcript_105064/g.250095 Transcript_105064/m.250095 type:complete len:302 (+) Transcript_105064:509-1414(+)
MQTDQSIVLDVYVILVSTQQGLPHLVCDVRRGGVGPNPRRSLGLALIELQWNKGPMVGPHFPGIRGIGALHIADFEEIGVCSHSWLGEVDLDRPRRRRHLADLGGFPGGVASDARDQDLTRVHGFEGHLHPQEAHGPTGHILEDENQVANPWVREGVRGVDGEEDCRLPRLKPGGAEMLELSHSVATHPGFRVDLLNGCIADFAGLVVLELSQHLLGQDKVSHGHLRQLHASRSHREHWVVMSRILKPVRVDPVVLPHFLVFHTLVVLLLLPLVHEGLRPELGRVGRGGDVRPFWQHQLVR